MLLRSLPPIWMGGGSRAYFFGGGAFASMKEEGKVEVELGGGGGEEEESDADALAVAVADPKAKTKGDNGECRGKGKDAKPAESRGGDEINDVSLSLVAVSAVLSVAVPVPVPVPVPVSVPELVVALVLAGADVDPEMLLGSPSWTPAVSTPSLVFGVVSIMVVVVEVAVAGLLLSCSLLLSVPVAILPPVAGILSASILLG